MTAITPEQMRALVDVCADCGGTLSTCEAAPVECCPDCQHYKPLIVAHRSAAAEVERLRTVIDNAPHADDCCIEDVTWVPGWEGAPTPLRGYCTCWKADAP